MNAFLYSSRLRQSRSKSPSAELPIIISQGCSSLLPAPNILGVSPADLSLLLMPPLTKPFLILLLIRLSQDVTLLIFEIVNPAMPPPQGCSGFYVGVTPTKEPKSSERLFLLVCFGSLLLLFVNRTAQRFAFSLERFEGLISESK